MEPEQELYILGMQSNENEHESEEEDNTSYMTRVRTRKGKWTEEEETYTMKLIEAFIAGVLPLAQGTTLRSFLSDKLCCDPMRITKKFAGSNGIGKQIFSPTSIQRERGPLPIQLEIDELERRFFQRIEYTLSAGINEIEFPQQPVPVVHAKKKRQAASVLESDHATKIEISGYHVAVPSLNNNEILLTYADIIRLMAKTVVSTAPSALIDARSTEPAAAPVSRKYNSLSGAASKLQKAGEKGRGYVDKNYRVAGFEHLAENEALGALDTSAPKPKTKRRSKAAESKELFLQNAHAAAVKGKESMAICGGTSTVVSGSAFDLQASSLLLDFFHSAREKGGNESEMYPEKERVLSIPSDNIS